MASYKSTDDMPLIENIRTTLDLPYKERYHHVLPSIGTMEATKQGHNLLRDHFNRAAIYDFDDRSCELVAELMQPTNGRLIEYYLKELRPVNNIFAFEFSNAIICHKGIGQPLETMQDRGFSSRVLFLCEVLRSDIWLMRVTPISKGPFGIMVSPISFMFSPINDIARDVSNTQLKLFTLIAQHFKDKHIQFAERDDLQLGVAAIYYYHNFGGYKAEHAELYGDVWENVSLNVSPYTGRSTFDNITNVEFGTYFVHGEKERFMAKDVAKASIINGFDASVASSRAFIAALLLLQLRDKIGVMAGRKTPARYWYKGKQRPYLSAHNVTISLPEKKVVQRLREVAHHEGGWRNRRHSVRGHWRQNGKTGNPLCGHRWENRNNNPDKQTCSICGRKRAFLKEFERGDASIGYVVKQYQVEADPK